MTTRRPVEVGVFGGSGFYAFLDDVEQVAVHTPYGAPSAPLAVGVIGERRVAFLPRHGVHHELAPHRVNFRANVWAMQSLGVKRLLGPCAVGSLRPDVHPGDFVVLDQLVDRTGARSADTFYDGGVVHHVSFADPYCPELRALVTAAGEAEGIRMHADGTVVVIPGPRFSTRAESAYYRRQGWATINMTQYPEAYLARELGICYAGVALVTDYDTGVEGEEAGPPVTMEDVFRVLRQNVERTRGLLARVVPTIPVDRAGACACASAAVDGPPAG